MQPNKLNYLESWTSEILACANRVRNLIGDAHWLSDGHHKEYLIRAFLRKHLPAHYLISRGFVSPAGNTAVASREVDVLIADAAAAAPWLNESELIIVPPDGVVAHLHSKTTFARAELDDALGSVDNTQLVCEESESFERIWTAIFFFSGGRFETAEEVLDLVVESVSSRAAVTHLPDFIVILDGPLVIFDRLENRDVQLRCFLSKPHSFALALANFFDRVATRHSLRASDWDRVLGTIGGQPPLAKKIQR
jgi:hypothetical protein